MKQVEKVVKSKGKPDITIKVPQYESVAEAHKAEGEEKTLALINRMKATDLANAARATSGPPTAAKLIGKLPLEAQAQVEAILIKAGQLSPENAVATKALAAAKAAKN